VGIVGSVKGYIGPNEWGGNVGLVTITSTQTVLGKASILIATTRTLTGKSNVRVTTIRTIQGVGRVVFVTTQTLRGKASVLVAVPVFTSARAFYVERLVLDTVMIDNRVFYVDKPKILRS